MAPTSPLFNASDADLVILSGGSEPTEFRVHRCILAAASPFFRDMFSLPQSCDSETKLPLQEISVSEPALIWTSLLQFIYPVDNPDIDNLDDLVVTIETALKYDFTAVISILKSLMVSPRFVETQPLRVFAVACRYEFEEEAKIASRYTLRENIMDAPLTDDLKYLSAHSYRRLIDLHKSRARAAQELIRPAQNLKCPQCNSFGHSAFTHPKWWKEFETRAKQELEVRPVSDVIFSISFLAHASTAGCPKCPANVFESSQFLVELKKRIDELPSTI